MRPSTGTVFIVVIVAGLILGGTLYWETTGSPSPLCGGCYRYNAPGCFVTPCPGRELLGVETSQVNSPTNVTLNIRNIGEVPLSLKTYNVKDGNGNQYTKMNWTSPFVNPNQLATITIVIDGTAFTFRSGNIYTITVISTRNNQFTYSLRV
jgi:hypothetical protein